MKKTLSYFMILAMLMMSLVVPTEKFQAYEANLTVAVSSSTVKIGDTVTVTIKVPGAVSGPVSLYFSTSIFEYVSADTEASVNGGTVQVSIGKGGRAASDTVKIKLKAKTSTGDSASTIKVEASGDIYDYDSLESVTLKAAAANITVENQAADSGDGGTTDTKSADNSLSSLKLSSGTLSPNFKRNVTKYTATVGYDVTKVVVSAKTSNQKATIESVTDNGTVNLKVGENTIKIVVKAENGVKATYTIVVTRKAQDAEAPDPSESESQSESEEPIVNEMLQWNGEQLQATEEIPVESVPKDFESTLVVVNGQQMQGLSFAKGDLKVLYLNNTNGAGSLYVYDEVQQTIYPFIKLDSEKSYVMVLLPDEQNAPAPEGFESCTFSIEGKGLVSAYQLKDKAPAGEEEIEDSTMTWNIFGAETFHAAEAKLSDFYLIYCMNDAGEKGWYMYDSVEGTFQRYLASAYSVQTGGEVSDSSNTEDDYAKLEKELKTAKMTQYIIIAVAAAVVLILIIVIIVLVVKNRNKDEEFFDEYEDEYYDEEDEEVVEEVVVETPQVVLQEKKTSKVEDEAYVDTMSEVEDPTSILSSKKEDDDDLEFIDFE